MSTRSRILMLGALAVFAAAAAVVVLGASTTVDGPVAAAIQSSRSPTMTGFFAAVTAIGGGWVLVGITALGAALLTIFDRRAAIFAVVSMVGAGLLNTGLKELFGRARPDAAAALAEATHYAFPSGHSMGTAALAAVVAIVALRRFPRSRRAIGAIVALPLLVGLSRIYLGVHFPTDVLAGWALGLSWVLGLSWLFFRGPTATPAREIG